MKLTKLVLFVIVILTKSTAKKFSNARPDQVKEIFSYMNYFQS